MVEAEEHMRRLAPEIKITLFCHMVTLGWTFNLYVGEHVLRTV